MAMSNKYICALKLTKEIPENNYLNDIEVVKQLKAMEQLEITANVTFLVGENGIGKSTLIEAIAVAMGFNPEGGTKNINFSTKDTHSALCDYLTVCRGIRKPRDGFFLRAESFYNVASNLDELGEQILLNYGGLSLHKQSHGESFLALVENRFGGNGLYILDEPEAALSPTRLLRLMCNMRRLEKNNSQFIIATHSPILMAYPGADVCLFSEDGIAMVDYRQTEHYQITRRFLENPDKMYKVMFDEE